VDDLVAQLGALDRAHEAAAAVLVERRRLVSEHAATRPLAVAPAPDPASGPEPLAALVAAADHQLVAAEQHAAQLAAQLATDTAARARRARAHAEVSEAERALEVDRILGEVIGSHDGKRLRSFSQSLTLDGLLA